MVRKRENIQWAAVVWTKLPCWCQRPEENGYRWWKGNSNSNNHSLQPRYAECISERTTLRTLNQMGYNSRRPHRVPLLSAKNSTRRIQFTQAHQNWTIEDWKTFAWSDESRFLLRHSDVRVRIWCKEHESMDPSSLNGSGWWWWCKCVGDIFLAHTRGLSTNWALFKRHSLPKYCCGPCPSLYDYSAPIFWWLLPAG